MSCNCKVIKCKYEKLQKKYVSLKKNHKKLIEVTVLLTDILEELVKTGINDDISDTLASCFTLYPDLFQNVKNTLLQVKMPSNQNPELIVDEYGKIYEPASESEKEYYEGFLARPKIPRTPQQSSV